MSRMASVYVCSHSCLLVGHVGHASNYNITFDIGLLA